MRKFFALMMFTMIVVFSACGPTAEEQKEKARQDSIRQADSIAKLVVEAESYDVYLAGTKDTAAFKAKYAGKHVILKNLVVNGIWSDKVVQCLAYSPSENMLSNPSREGDVAKKISKWQDLVQGTECKYNTDLVSFSWYFKLSFAAPIDASKLKERDLKEEKMTKICNYPTVLTIEGDSLSIESNNFILKNCVIKENVTK